MGKRNIVVAIAEMVPENKSYKLRMKTRRSDRWRLKEFPGEEMVSKNRKYTLHIVVGNAAQNRMFPEKARMSGKKDDGMDTIWSSSCWLVLLKRIGAIHCLRRGAGRI